MPDWAGLWAWPWLASPWLQGIVAALRFANRELTIFALTFLLLGLADELAMDAAWAWLHVTGRISTRRLSALDPAMPFSGPLAVLIPAWREAAVIGTTLSRMMRLWPQAELRIYLGTYRNDLATYAAAIAAAQGDPRLSLIVHDADGPTTKADCLNCLYRALVADEQAQGARFRAVVFHDAEDMVHPLELQAIDRALAQADFVQLPVRPEPLPGSRWISGHYLDEFAEQHGKAMVVRDALGTAVPAAGTGYGITRDMLDRLAGLSGAGASGPFAADSLTEDYELGWAIARCGGRARFLRLRDAEGNLVAVRSLFPGTMRDAVRQKARWVHGIALQGWDRLGWPRRAVDRWMSLRDRRGPIAALVLMVAYAQLLVGAVLMALAGQGWAVAPAVSPFLRDAGLVCLAGVGWRALTRSVFTAREYGWHEGLLAMPRIWVANYIAILSGRDAFAAYLRTLRGGALRWDKTAHPIHAADVAGAAS